VQALGSQSYTALQLMQIIGDRRVRLIPDILVGSQGSNSGLGDALLSLVLWNQTKAGALPQPDGAGSSQPGMAPEAPPVPVYDGVLTTNGVGMQVPEPPAMEGEQR
jgi:uncharacterized membrane protein YqiK